MVEIPEPYVRTYPLVTVKKDDLLELYYLFKEAPLPGLSVAINITARGSTHIMGDSPGPESSSRTEEELKDLLRNRDKVLTGFFIEGRQKVESPPQISVCLKLGKNDAKLTIIKPRTISRKDSFALDGVEEGIGKILLKTPRLPDNLLDSPYTVMVAASAAGLLAYMMPAALPTGIDPLNRGLLAVFLVVTLWLLNKFRAYKTSHVLFDTDSEDDRIQQLNRTLKKYSRELIGGAVTLSISLIVLFITWFFHLA